MKENEETITIRVKKSKVRAFRQLLKLLDFVDVETPAQKINRYIKTAPENVPLDDEKIMSIIKRSNS